MADQGHLEARASGRGPGGDSQASKAGIRGPDRSLAPGAAAACAGGAARSGTGRTGRALQSRDHDSTHEGTPRRGRRPPEDTMVTPDIRRVARAIPPWSPLGLAGDRARARRARFATTTSPSPTVVTGSRRVLLSVGSAPGSRTPRRTVRSSV